MVTSVIHATPVGTGLYWECCKMALDAAACFLMAQLGSCSWTSGCWGKAALHLPPWKPFVSLRMLGRIRPFTCFCNTGEKALEETYPMLMHLARKPDPQGCAVSFKLPFLFFFLVESTIGVRSQRRWFYLKVLWSWKCWAFCPFIFTKFGIKCCVW